MQFVAVQTESGERDDRTYEQRAFMAFENVLEKEFKGPVETVIKLQ